MTFFQALLQRPFLLIGFILVGLYLVFWVFVSVAIIVSKRAREYFSTFFPQWFGRNGRPFTDHEKIGAGFQLVAVLIILFLLSI